MDPLIAYIPTDRRHALAQGIQLPDRTQGAALFADISGFTPLSEGLAERLGPQAGAEELTKHLNAVYSALIAELDRFRGSVIGFSGDAITCWFEGDQGLRAAACALHMQRAMGQFASVQLASGVEMSLGMKVSMAAGQARRFLVGDPARQVLDALAGRLLDELAAAEGLAERGEVVLASSAVRSLADAVQIREWRTQPDDDPVGVVDELRQTVEPDPWPQLSAGSLSREVVRPWLLPAAFDRLTSGQGEFLAELRPAVALFLRFEGIEYDQDDKSGSKLDELIRSTQGVLVRYEGSLIDLTIGDKGSYLYAAFGAPVAHEDDSERAALAAIEIRALIAELPFLTSLRIGINRGRMRTGAYGGPTRRTYGVLGDATNLAARLMQAAQPGEILVSHPTYQVIESRLRWLDHADVKVKGKAKPVGVLSLVGTSSAEGPATQPSRHDALPMVGREVELEALRSRLEAVSHGRGQIVAITAEAGMGKSRLVAEVSTLVAASDIPLHLGECKSYGTNSSYLVWTGIWRSLFGLGDEAAPEGQIRRAQDRLERVDAGLVPRLPLLGPVLNLRIPDNPLTLSFDAKLRKSSLEALLLDCLRHFAHRQPRLLVLEDLHWIDPLSQDLLAAVGKAMANWPVLILLTSRPAAEGESGSHGVEHLPHFHGLRLSSLSPEYAERLVTLKSQALFGEGAQPPEAFVNRLLTRAEGNPFYIEELLTYLKVHGIPLEDESALEQVDLPASLHSLVLTRIDRLQEQEKSLLRLASIIGRSFEADDLWRAFPQSGGEQASRQGLERLVQHEFTVLESPQNLSYLFKHSVIQEVAYASLPLETRAGLHDSLGGYLERAHAEVMESQLDLLAFHYDRSHNEPKKREYLRKAGEAAQAKYANAAAIQYYRKLLPLLTEKRQVEAMLRLGQVLELVGEWGEADGLYRQALELGRAQGDRPAQARCETAIGELFRKQGQYDEAGDWLQRALVGFQELQDEAEAARVLHFAGTLGAQQGDYERAQALYEQSLAIRRRLDDKTGLASLLSNLGIVARYRGQVSQARALFEESLSVRRALGDRWAIANSLNNLSTVSQDQGDFEAAWGQLEEAVGLLREIGDRWHFANALNNLANVARSRGDYPTARSLYLESLEINRQLGDGWALAYLLEDIGCLNAAEGHAQQALRLVGAAQALRESIGAPLPPHERENLDRLLGPATQALSPEAQTAARQAGGAMSLDQALDFALAESSAPLAAAGV
jgi:class 3 adenylate cyclase/tetratricopeptide (TPR) repeat protein